MPLQTAQGVENNFTKGLLTEFTGLNFPENGATDTDNCAYTLIGDVSRRLGFDYEDNFVLTSEDRSGMAMSQYKWNNAGGDGLSQIVVEQLGPTLIFYLSSLATIAAPVSARRLATEDIDLIPFKTSGPFDTSAECQYADGNGYLIVTHPSCDPVCIQYDPTTNAITASAIIVSIRDFLGTTETLGTNVRPTTLSRAHQYNLNNQGWTTGSAWNSSSSTTNVVGIGVKVFTTASGLPITNGDVVSFSNASTAFPGGTYQPPGSPIMAGTVTGYVGTTLTVSIFTFAGIWSGSSYSDWIISPNTQNGYITTWNSAIGNYPSNADVWWTFKNAGGVFDPATTVANTSIDTGPAPKGHFIYNAFNQTRSLTSGVDSLDNIATIKRPRTCAWFQGRAFYAGVDAQQQPADTAPYYTWTENIYFSQVVLSTGDLGKCYQTNSPTSETLFDLLPTDGGVITIPGCGSIFKLFSIQNGLLVFAANGIWFITGSQGIGFAATDYTVTNISYVRSISSCSFVNVQGLPYFWNEEGIYSVSPQQGGGLVVNPITVSTIQSYYDTIPLACKKLARGDYHPIDYTIQWVFKDTDGVDVTDSYNFNKILNFNTYNKAFYPYTISSGDNGPYVNNVLYLAGPGGSTSPPSAFKYFTSIVASPWNLTFSDEHDEDYVDWDSALPEGLDYSSFFITGYKVRGQGMRKFQNQYINVFSRTNSEPLGYALQGLWDYSNTGSSGRWSSKQTLIRNNSKFDVLTYRHKVRGHGLALQFKVSSVEGMPFDIIGWSTIDTVESGV